MLGILLTEGALCTPTYTIHAVVQFVQMGLTVCNKHIVVIPLFEPVCDGLDD